MDTQAGGSAELPKRRSKTPPRTLPGHLDKTNPLSFETRYQPFSPVKSPGRTRTLREYEDDINNLKSENFNLKVRIYFIEQSRIDQGVPKDIDELRNAFTELKYNYERQSKDLDSKEDLLLNTYRALEVQRSQIESMKTEHEAEKQGLLNKVETLENKIDELEKDLRDYQVKFMESSLQLDDTNTLYAVTFGLKPPKKDDTEELQNKITELEGQLVKEKEEVLRLESEVAQLNLKNEKDLKKLHHLHEHVADLEQKLMTTLKEKSSQEVEQQEAYNTARKAVKKYQEALRLKESEVDSLKSMVMDFEQRLSSLKGKLQDTKSGSEVETSTTQRLIKTLMGENAELKKELRYFQQQSRSRSSGGKRHSEEENNQDSATQVQVQQLQQKILELKSQPVGENPKYKSLVQSLLKENKTLKNAVEDLRSENLHLRSYKLENSAKEEVTSNFDAQLKQMTSEKDLVISALNEKIEELNKVINDQEKILQEYKNKLKDDVEAKKIKTFEETCHDESQGKRDIEKDTLQKELEEQKKEVESLKKDLKKKTYNLQGLVNTELWDKNREIEKLNKVCERKHMEVLALQKQLREFPLTLMQEKMRSVQNNIFTEDKENLEPITDARTQIQQLLEENRLLDRKVKELEARLLNTPERDTESSLVQTLRQERDNAERLRKEAVNACVLLTTRLQELADFLDSLLPFLGGRKRRVVQRAVERSRELSRFSKSSFMEVVFPLVKDQLKNETTRGLPLPPILKLLTVLRFYATGCFQIVCGDLFKVSQPTVSRLVELVSTLLAGHVKTVIKFPEDLAQTRVNFKKMAQFPGVIGCIDCTHVPIMNPGGGMDLKFKNRKGWFSINVQVVVGPEGEIYNLVARWPGSVHDSRIFDNCALKVMMEGGELQGLLLGDSGYAQTEFLFTPAPEPVNNREARYNRSHRTTRSCIERCFGRWKRRFPCLSQGLRTKDVTILHIISSCAVLHNISMQVKEVVPECEEFDNPFQQPRALPQNERARGRAIRNAFITIHF